VQEQQGIVGALDLGLVDLLSKDSKHEFIAKLHLVQQVLHGRRRHPAEAGAGLGHRGQVLDSEIKQERR